MTPVGDNDNTTTYDSTSKVNFQATAQTRYMIVVDGRNGASGIIHLAWRPFFRLARLYLQDFNGGVSSYRPTDITASNGTTTVSPIELSQGVYEFNLPDNTVYDFAISGPPGIGWRNRSRRWNQLYFAVNATPSAPYVYRVYQRHSAPRYFSSQCKFQCVARPKSAGAGRMLS